MPILGALAVIDRIEKVMKEGFAGSIHQIEANLVAEGTLTVADPTAVIPTDAEYGRDEDPATDTVTSVITRCNSSEITNEPSNHGDLHWSHEMVVEVITVAEIIAGDRLLNTTHVYGAALVQLLAAARPSLELSTGAGTNDGYLSADAQVLGAGWSQVSGGTVFADDDTDVRNDRTSKNALEASVNMSGQVPNRNVLVTGIEVRIRGNCQDASSANRVINMTLWSGDRRIGVNTIQRTLVNSASDSAVTVGGSTELWGSGGLGAGLLDADLTVKITPNQDVNDDAGIADLFIDHVEFKVYYKLLQEWGGSIVNNIGPVRYRNEFNEAGAFWIRSASVVMEVQRREIND